MTRTYASRNYQGTLENKYEADDLPDAATPAWTANSDPNPSVASTVEIIQPGILHVAATVAGDEAIEWELADSDISSATGTTYEFSLKMVTGALLATNNQDQQIWYYNGSKTFIIYLYTDGIADNAGSTIHAFDTTDDYHTYRITEKNGTCNVYIDGILRGNITGTGSTALKKFVITPTAASGTNDVEFYLDYFYYSTNGNYPPRQYESSRGYESSRAYA